MSESEAERETPVTIGRVFADKYRVDGLLGNGGMGLVFAATHLQLETRVAIKLLRSEVSRTQTATARLLREARATAKINSENVARILDVGTVDWSGLYIVMEYLEGEDLSALIQKQPRWAPDQAVGHVLQACEGVRAAHALGVIHRDLKPSNLFVTKDASGAPRIKVLDFGLSKLIDPETGSPIVTRGGGQLTLPDSILGTPAYTSPEQLTDPRTVDARTDIYSLGVILFELLTGQKPLQAKTMPELCELILNGKSASVRELRPELPPALDAIVQRCLKRSPAERYADVAALMKDLAPFARPADAAPPSEPVTPPAPSALAQSPTGPSPLAPSPASTPSPPVVWRRWAAIAAGLLVTIGLVVAILGRYRRPPPLSAVTAAAETTPVPSPAVAVQTCGACVAANCAREYKACRANRVCWRALSAYNACVQQSADPLTTTGCRDKLAGSGRLPAQRLSSCVFARGSGSSAVPGKCAGACTAGVLGPS